MAFFSILLKDKSELLCIIIIILAISLTVSTVDTLVNAISSLIIVDGKKINKKLKFPNILVICLSIIALFVASKGFSILYLFLQIRNPATRRCVSKTGKIGKQLVATRHTRTPSFSEPGPSRAPVTQQRLQFIDQLRFLPPEMIMEIVKNFNHKDADNFIKAYPHYKPFFQDKFLNKIAKFPPEFPKGLKKQIATMQTKLVKMEQVMKTIAKYPNDKHVVYIGKFRLFHQMMTFMENKGYDFLKYSYRTERQTKKNVERGIKRQLVRDDGERLVYDYMTIGRIFYPHLNETNH